MIQRRNPIRRKRLGPARRGRLRDPLYLAWIRTLPCMACYRGVLEILRVAHLPEWERSEAAHIGMRGLSQKSSDRETMPLCVGHHRWNPHSLHTMGKNFWDHYRLNRRGIIAELNRLYEEQR